MSSYESAFKTISGLVKDFKENEKIYLRSEYSEADVRNDFINKFFIALGWDVRHDIQKNPYEQEVRVEKPVQVAKAQKRADYTFYLAPNFRDVKFFVEAKKPFHDLINKDYFFQTVRYGWNANTPVAILTDFEELIILDCRYKPDINEILSCKIKKYHYQDYTKEDLFSEIYFLFSHDNVIDNSIEKYANDLPKPRGKAVQRGFFAGGFKSIDDSFLEELDAIRTSLAKSFKKNNSHLTSEELTEATQRTIDRLVFMKFLEDKLIEPHHYVSEFGNHRSAWEDFISTSLTLDAKYNGVVFKKSIIDTRNIVEPDNQTFSNICEDLSHENSPYNFDAIPIHILGSIYERFLGKVVNATDKRVTVEEKPEVRKAGGVYYTPQYVVNYIVNNSIGKLIDGKSPKEISRMKFADIACGSGSFLITVYEKLLDYYKQWYINFPKDAKKDGCIWYEGAYRLSLKQKQNILLNNIFGVDLDRQAVEVTQLSLYLKLLEDETTATANDTWVMFKERLLPPLKNNIICGNSLIGSDILDGSLFNFEEERKLNPMDLDEVFPDIMKSGGFDAIIGNPPYGADYGKDIKHYLAKKFNIIVPIADTYLMFLLKSMDICKSGALISFILPSTWLYMPQYFDIRKNILHKCSLNEMLLFRKAVFKQAIVETCIALISNIKATKSTDYHFKEVINEPAKFNYIEFIVKQNDVINDKYSNLILSNPIHKLLFEKIYNNKPTLKDIALVVCGLTPYRLGKGNPPQDSRIVSGRVFDSDHKIDSTYRRYIMGKDFHRYSWQIETERWISYGNWLAEPRYKAPFNEDKKIVIRQTADKLIAQLDDKQYLSFKNVHNVKIKTDQINYEYLLGLLNSKLLTWWYQRLIPEKGRIFAEVKVVNLEKIPIKVVDPTNELEVNLYNRLSELVNQLLVSKQKLLQTRTESDRDYLERKCENIINKIDESVFRLYELTKEEIKIIEDNLQRK